MGLIRLQDQLLVEADLDSVFHIIELGFAVILNLLIIGCLALKNVIDGMLACDVLD